MRRAVLLIVVLAVVLTGCTKAARDRFSAGRQIAAADKLAAAHDYDGAMAGYLKAAEQARDGEIHDEALHKASDALTAEIAGQSLLKQVSALRTFLGKTPDGFLPLAAHNWLCDTLRTDAEATVRQARQMSASNKVLLAGGFPASVPPTVATAVNLTTKPRAAVRSAAATTTPKTAVQPKAAPKPKAKAPAKPKATAKPKPKGPTKTKSPAKPAAKKPAAKTAAKPKAPARPKPKPTASFSATATPVVPPAEATVTSAAPSTAAPSTATPGFAIPAAKDLRTVAKQLPGLGQPSGVQRLYAALAEVKAAMEACEQARAGIIAGAPGAQMSLQRADTRLQQALRAAERLLAASA
jgi:hypothetical protein